MIVIHHLQGEYIGAIAHGRIDRHRGDGVINLLSTCPRVVERSLTTTHFSHHLLGSHIRAKHLIDMRDGDRRQLL